MSRARPPGPGRLTGLGNTLRLARNPLGFYEACASYGDVARAQVGREELYVATHPTLVERVLVDDAGSYRRPDLLQARVAGPFAGVSPTGDRWNRLRSVSHPTRDLDRVTAYADATVDHAGTMAALWSDGETVAVDEAMAELTLDVFLDALFGADADHHERGPALGAACGGRAAGDGERIRETVRAFAAKHDASVPAAVPGWVPTRTNRRYRAALAAFDDVVGRLVERRRAAGFEGCRDLLSVLLRADGDLDESTVADTLLAFLVTAAETTAAALTFTLHALATNPSVADRLAAEVDAVLGGERASAGDLDALGYTERVVRESLRRYPPLYATYRWARRDTELAGYDVPAGTAVVLPQLLVHNDERWFTAPTTFRPERWATWAGPEHAYFPFSGGPRHCLGTRLAMQELQLVVATLAQRVTFEPVDDGPLELAFGTTLRPANGLGVVVHQRAAAPEH